MEIWRGLGFREERNRRNFTALLGGETEKSYGKTLKEKRR
jgi:hypothetical protein